MKKLIFFILLLISNSLTANDGAYYASGNQLIPIIESKISVKKEVLKIKRVSEEVVEVNVKYHFFNPDSKKALLVGFEAPSPEGDVDGTPKNGKHPYISDFSVTVNGKKSLLKQLLLQIKSI